MVVQGLKFCCKKDFGEKCSGLSDGVLRLWDAYQKWLGIIFFSVCRDGSEADGRESILCRWLASHGLLAPVNDR